MYIAAIFLSLEQLPLPLPLTLTAYPTPTPGLGSKFFCALMTGKVDPTISCSHLMVELSVLAGWIIILKGVTNPPSLDED